MRERRRDVPGHRGSGCNLVGDVPGHPGSGCEMGGGCPGTSRIRLRDGWGMSRDISDQVARWVGDVPGHLGSGCEMGGGCPGTSKPRRGGGQHLDPASLAAARLTSLVAGGGISLPGGQDGVDRGGALAAHSRTASHAGPQALPGIGRQHHDDLHAGAEARASRGAKSSGSDGGPEERRSGRREPTAAMSRRWALGT